jgi:hypothetical protein
MIDLLVVAGSLIMRVLSSNQSLTTTEAVWMNTISSAYTLVQNRKAGELSLFLCINLRSRLEV